MDYVAAPISNNETKCTEPSERATRKGDTRYANTHRRRTPASTALDVRAAVRGIEKGSIKSLRALIFIVRTCSLFLPPSPAPTQSLFSD